MKKIIKRILIVLGVLTLLEIIPTTFAFTDSVILERPFMEELVKQNLFLGMFITIIVTVLGAVIGIVYILKKWND